MAAGKQLFALWGPLLLFFLRFSSFFFVGSSALGTRVVLRSTPILLLLLSRVCGHIHVRLNIIETRNTEGLSRIFRFIYFFDIKLIFVKSCFFPIGTNWRVRCN